jgi:hypothetical protein
MRLRWWSTSRRRARPRWFAAKARGLGIVRVEDWAALRDDPPLALLLVRADEARYLGRRLASDLFEQPASISAAC